MAQSTKIQGRVRNSIPAAHVIVKIEEWKRQRREMRPVALVWEICPRCKGAGCDECWGMGTIQTMKA